MARKALASRLKLKSKVFRIKLLSTLDMRYIHIRNRPHVQCSPRRLQACPYSRALKHGAVVKVTKA